MEESDDDTITKPKENFIKKVIKNITIEPAMFVISLAVMLDGVSYGQMVLEKSCKVDFGFNDTVCDNLVHDFKEENELVQNEVRNNISFSSKNSKYIFEKIHTYNERMLGKYIECIRIHSGKWYCERFFYSIQS